MAEWGNLGKLLIGIGATVMVVGGLMLLADRSSVVGSLLGWLGKLPGDIYIKRDNFTFFFPSGPA